MRYCAAVFLTSLLAGCMLFDVEEQQQKLGELCTFTGKVNALNSKAAIPSHSTAPTIALLATRAANDAAGDWRAIDYFVIDESGRWSFLTPAGLYRVVAFGDNNSDLAYQAGEPLTLAEIDSEFTCVAGARFGGVELNKRLSPKHEFDALDLKVAHGNQPKTLGQLTAVGEIVSLDDERFDLERASRSLWRPFDSMQSTRPGVYFLEPYDARKVPVLFVHGISDSPARFASLIANMDRSRLQPWLYYYPSGIHLEMIADHLAQTVAKLRVRHDVDKLAVVAHSIGGLVARNYLQNSQASSFAAPALFITISTPWEGHKAAENGVRFAPTVVHVWHDIAPGSAYIRDLFTAPLPDSTRHHMLFSYRRDGSSQGESGDQAVTVASQLSGQAQHEATRIYGFDDTHRGMLQNAAVSQLINELLANHF